jgi:hypothetical protein
MRDRLTATTFAPLTRHCRPKCLGSTTVVEAAGMAPPQPHPNLSFIAADRHGNEHKGAHAQPGAFCCLEFDVMREVNYSCLMMPQTGPALRGAFCFAPPQLAAC